MNLSDIELLFKFVGGLGMFIYGMNVMANGLQQAAGSKAKHLLNALTKNRLLAVFVGAGITAIIQSSSATTVMVIGFVNARLMDLAQAVGVIMGANIGTTMTSFIVSMNEWSSVLKPEFIAPLIIAIGAVLTTFSTKESKKRVGEIAIGFGLLFIGLSFMSGAIAPYKDSPLFVDMFKTFGSNPFLGVLVGLGVTAIIQSSSASVGILQTLALNGIVSWNAAIFITLGQNIGTCVTALLSSIGTNRTAKRASIIHLLFNVIGTLVFGTIIAVVFIFIPDFANSKISSLEISFFHATFNILNTIILFPFANKLVKLSGLIIKEKPVKEEGAIDTIKKHLDKRILTNTNLAIEALHNEICDMGNLALDNLKLSIDALINSNEESIKKVYENENLINNYEKLLSEYIVCLDNSSLTASQHNTVKTFLYTISDLERISDHCENIAELATNKLNEDAFFSDEGIKDMSIINECVILSLENAIKAFDSGDSTAISGTQFYENKVDDLEMKLREKHIQRLSTQVCTVNSGIIFLDAISNLERVSDHALNIAEYK